MVQTELTDENLRMVGGGFDIEEIIRENTERAQGIGSGTMPDRVPTDFNMQKNEMGIEDAETAREAARYDSPTLPGESAPVIAEGLGNLIP